MPANPAFPQIVTAPPPLAFDPQGYQKLVADTLGNLGDSTDGTDELIQEFTDNQAAFAAEVAAAGVNVSGLSDVGNVFNPTIATTLFGQVAAARSLVQTHSDSMSNLSGSMSPLPPLPLYLSVAGGPTAGPPANNDDLPPVQVGFPSFDTFFGFPIDISTLAQPFSVVMEGGAPVITNARFVMLPLYSGLLEPEIFVTINPVAVGDFSAFVEVLDANGNVILTSEVTISVVATLPPETG